MKCCRILIVVILAVQAAFADEPGRISVSEPSFDFGTVQEGATVDHDFAVKNTGTGPLTISRVVASCGCTASAASKPTLQPNEEGAVKTRFDTAGFPGNVTKTVTLYSSDPDAPMVVLTIKGTIEPGVTVNPQRLAFGEVIKGAAASQEFAVEVRGSSQSKIISAKSFSRYITVEEKSADERKKVYLATLSEDLPLEEFRARISVTVQGADGKQREINVPVFASVKGALRLTPPVLALGILEGEDPVERSAKLDYVGPGRVTITSVNSTDKAVTVAVKEVKKGRNFLLQVKADPSGVTKELRAAVTVTAIDGEGEENTASLNVYGMLPPR